MYFFTSDEHYGHANIIKYCNRPFNNVDEMNAELIKRHNEVVGANDTVIHAGDFCWPSAPDDARMFIRRLKGNHVFLIGSHDRWQRQSIGKYKHIWEKNIDGQIVVVCLGFFNFLVIFLFPDRVLSRIFIETHIFSCIILCNY